MNDDSKTTYIDLSHLLDEATTPFPGDPPVEIEIFSSTQPDSSGKRGIANGSAIRTSLHCGTHMDAPFHFCGDRPTIDQVPLEPCIGPTALIPLPGTHEITTEQLRPFEERIRATGRVVLNTGWHHRWDASEYHRDFPEITGDAARFLVDTGVRLVGVDFASVDRAPHAAHLTLLGSDVVIVENLTNLDAIPTDVFQLIALPLRVGGRDGSPVRAVAVV